MFKRIPRQRDQMMNRARARSEPCEIVSTENQVRRREENEEEHRVLESQF